MLKAPGQSKYEPITLERGVTHDVDFEQWANKVWNYGSGLGAEVSLKDFRKDIRIEMLNEAGQVAIAYNLYRCWVSEFTAMPELDASANAVAIQMLTLQNEGWERDLAVTAPSTPLNQSPTSWLSRIQPWGDRGRRERRGRNPAEASFQTCWGCP